VKLAGMMGVFLGLAVLPALLAAFLFGSVVGLGIMAARGVAARKQAVPFGPFLALGALVGLFAGQNLIALYAAAFIH
jgi:leader peptidase (prepilin peptidase)/N-methyltransferase